MAYDIKTKKQRGGITAYLEAVQSDERRADAKRLLALLKKTTGKQPVLWGTSIIGFGSYSYETKSKCRGEWPMVGFAVRKNDLSLYIMPGFTEYTDLLDKLGPHKTGSSCLYIKRLSDIDERVLEKLIRRSYIDMRTKYGSA